MANLLEECWEWKGSRNPEGYGRKQINGYRTYTHRLAWEWSNGPIPEGMMILHTCDNPPCCNPNHLFLGTQSDNMIDMRDKGRGWLGRHNSSKTECKNGHAFDERNTYIRPDGNRGCRKCRIETSRRYYYGKVRDNGES